ncbi:MAG: hypothetical protein H0U74_21350 [Bradymonadaceae bacterium]|nr:hypothetical protein [Lujinxingiaceae bacterium]
MSEDKDELSADELDALLRDLEGRASGGGKPRAKAAATEEDSEDLEAFLKALEADDARAAGAAPKTRTATAVDDPFAAQFAELEATDAKAMAKTAQEAPPKGKDKKEAAAQAKEKAKDGEKLAKTDKKADDGAPGRGRRALKVLKWTAIVVPVLTLWWVVGLYLAQWISAGWLVAAVATSFVFGLPALLRHFARRGHYVYWLSGAALALTVGLVAPMPNTAGQTMAEYGHWPASALGLSGDHFLVEANAALGQFVGGLLAPSAADQAAHRLGTDQPLGPAVVAPPAPPAVQPAPTEAPVVPAPGQ